MKPRILALLALLLSGSTNGCRSSSVLSDITRIVYTSQSGAILPELQWYEQYVVTSNQVILERRGIQSETQVAAGFWGIAVDGQTISDLVAQLGAVELSSIERMDPADPLDGGSTSSYTVHCAGGKALELRFDPGTEYRGGAQITAPIDAFIGGLSLPAEALSRYQDRP
jgi:hypothetical protein